jgi:drug/metabolite transporter (DMT)-like permease
MIAGPGGDRVFSGVAAALAAALCWTLASFLWRRLPTSLGAAQLNLLKNALALLLQVPLLGLLWQPQQPEALLQLAISGVVGIAAGDSLFFAALRRLGARRSLTLEAAAPALTTLAGLLLLAEWPDPSQVVGLALISGAVVLVAQRPGVAPAPGGALAASQRQGLLLILAALVCGSAGALLARQALAAAPVSGWQAAGVRLAAATMVQMPLLPGLLRGAWGGVGPAPARPRWPLVLLATLLGTTLGISLQQSALALLPAGQAVTLMATAPTMAALLAPIDGDHPGRRGWLAALLALLGVLLVV